MRLINTTTFKIVEFPNDQFPDPKPPPYAILSHTWQKEECTFKQMEELSFSKLRKRVGFEKIRQCCREAIRDKLDWAWVDTCCIDKTSTSELSEAINSMFRWYREAKTCYAYLSDVTNITQMETSRWFTRGWTLQELVAPESVLFFNKDWRYLGEKRGLQERLRQITTIEEEALIHGRLDAIPVARKMGWAKGRETSKTEDLAYCLLGIFNVNMPLLYGEGEKSFRRLQEEILKSSDDHSLFAWGASEVANIPTMENYQDSWLNRPPPPAGWNPWTTDLFATSPSKFTYSESIHVMHGHQSSIPPIVSGEGVRLELPVLRVKEGRLQFAVIQCTVKKKFDHFLAIPLFRANGERSLGRCAGLVLIPATKVLAKPSHPPSVLLIKKSRELAFYPVNYDLRKIVQVTNEYKDRYVMNDVQCASHVTYDPVNQVLNLDGDKDVLLAVFFFSPTTLDPIELLPIPLQQSTLDAVRHQESFALNVTSKKNKDSYSVVAPSFAIRVGGHTSNVWADAILVLNDDDSDADRQHLSKAHSGLVHSCSTKQQILASLGKDPMDWRRREEVESHPTQVMQWRYSCQVPDQWNESAPPGATIDENRIMRTFSMEGPSKQGLQVVLKYWVTEVNLVERAFVVSYEIKSVHDKEPISLPEDWWDFGRISCSFS